MVSYNNQVAEALSNDFLRAIIIEIKIIELN